MNLPFPRNSFRHHPMPSQDSSPPPLPAGVRAKRPSRHRDWVGVDFDATLAHYEGWKGSMHAGAPIMPMVFRVREMLANGVDVRIFTARVGPLYPDQIAANTATINDFCEANFGQLLPITCIKDQAMILLLDDRVQQVIPNTGETIQSRLLRLAKTLHEEGEHLIAERIANELT